MKNLNIKSILKRSSWSRHCSYSNMTKRMCLLNHVCGLVWSSPSALTFPSYRLRQKKKIQYKGGKINKEKEGKNEWAWVWMVCSERDIINFIQVSSVTNMETYFRFLLSLEGSWAHPTPTTNIKNLLQIIWI